MSFLKNYFNFTRRERNGILFLLFLIIFSWALYFSTKFFYTRDETNFYEFENTVKNFYALLDKNKKEKEFKRDSVIYYNKDTCFVNINCPKYEHLICLGLSNKLSQTWMNYIQKGGSFKSAEDVKRLWGMNDSIFYLIKDYLIVNDDIAHKTQIASNKRTTIVQMIEINTADTIQLKELPGIGSSFAKRIVKYRERLGGYVNKEQLKEIYGFTEELYKKIASYIYVDIFEIKKLNINTSDYYTLIQHPYLKKETVKSILQLRKTNGKIISKEELLYNNIITPEDWDNIKWYIEF